MAKEIIGLENFLEVFVNTPLEICEQRDTKGLYKKAREGKIDHFTGITSPYETPVRPAFIVTTHDRTVVESVQDVVDFIVPRLANGK